MRFSTFTANAIFAVFATLTIFVIVFGGYAQRDQLPSNPATVQVEEDSPMWDCHTMGNRICGTR